MKVYPLDYIIDHARKNSPFYKKLYEALGENPKLEELPLVKLEDFWAAAAKGEVNTGEHTDGQVFKSGGTTGEPKYSLYTAAEWKTMCEATGFYMPFGGLKHGDRVVNLFYGGNLYASFLYTYSIFNSSPASVLQFGLGGFAEISDIVETLVKHRINLIAGLPSMIMKIMEYIEGKGIAADLQIDAIYFAGETLFEEQRGKIRALLGENIEFRSMSYASNDAGIMAYFHKDCGFNEHRVCDAVCILELLDPETGEVIREQDRIGQIHITSLYKLLQPIIRYPSGDMGKYTEPEGSPDRKFMLLGRNAESARIGVATIHPQNVSEALDSLNAKYDGFQMIISRENLRDSIIFRIAGREVAGFVDKICEIQPLLNDCVTKGLVSTPKVEFCALSDLEYNKRTGKLMRIIDKRFA